MTDSIHTGSILISVTEPPSGISATLTRLRAADRDIITALTASFLTFDFSVSGIVFYRCCSLSSVSEVTFSIMAQLWRFDAERSRIYNKSRSGMPRDFGFDGKYQIALFSALIELLTDLMEALHSDLKPDRLL